MRRLCGLLVLLHNALQWSLPPRLQTTEAIWLWGRDDGELDGFSGRCESFLVLPPGEQACTRAGVERAELDDVDL